MGTESITPTAGLHRPPLCPGRPHRAEEDDAQLSAGCKAFALCVCSFVTHVPRPRCGPRPVGSTRGEGGPRARQCSCAERAREEEAGAEPPLSPVGPPTSSAGQARGEGGVRTQPFVGWCWRVLELSEETLTSFEVAPGGQVRVLCPERLSVHRAPCLPLCAWHSVLNPTASVPPRPRPGAGVTTLPLPSGDPSPAAPLVSTWP